MIPFERRMRDALVSKASLFELADILREYKAIGLSRREAYATLDIIRGTTTSDGIEDRVLEVMDVVTGYCRPELRVWDDDSKLD